MLKLFKGYKFKLLDKHALTYFQESYKRMTGNTIDMKFLETMMFMGFIFKRTCCWLYF